MMNGLLLMDGLKGFCSNTHQILAIVGWVLTVFKIAIPIIIIILGLIDLGKAAVSSKPEEIKKSATSLLYRLIGGIAIFFIPMLVMTVFGWISGWSSTTAALGEGEWDKCYTCIVAPWNDKAQGQWDNK